MPLSNACADLNQTYSALTVTLFRLGFLALHSLLIRQLEGASNEIALPSVGVPGYVATIIGALVIKRVGKGS